MIKVPGPRTAAVLLAAVGLTLLGVPATAEPPAAAPTRSTVQVSTTPERLDVVGLPCLPGQLTLTMINTGSESRYADLFLDPTGPLQLSRDIFSSWLPATDPDQPVSAPVEVRVPRDTEPGDHKITLRLDRSRLDVPVRVNPLPGKDPGSNLALGEQAAASSTHGNFELCGAVDGDADSEHWDTLTGWNDGTRAAFPDTYDVALAEPTMINKVVLSTLDSARYPARSVGLKDWDVQVRSGAGGWTTVAEVRGNQAGRVTSTFDPVRADQVRILCLAGNDNTYSRIVELEVYGS
ncbi:galactose-binding domain-containing protein [Microlunatus parietis]|uniref:F5/8 type C domain-containing protein n=1 Tax=Microlunatus parietis TaxID=682979 RepID=A0A7Y9I654_9ACTN|nr:hypothetical protein [Microlunatus parietis]NYE70998.1 hypothetical protein [Microlunatus parietis]